MEPQKAATPSQPAPMLSDRPTQFEVIPQVCLIPDVCRILKISRRTFEGILQRHELPLVELPRFDRRRRFTGESVARIIRMKVSRTARGEEMASSADDAPPRPDRGVVIPGDQTD